MASSEDYVLYACEQMSNVGQISYRKMFGDYALYCNGKVIGLICDNQVFIKPTPAAEKFIPGAERKPPYQGAKPYVVLQELDDREFLAQFITAVYEQLPSPKPKNKKKSNDKL